MLGYDRSAQTRSEQIVLELVSTEQKYVQVLESVSLLKRLLNEQALLQEEVLDEVFGDADALARFHRRFLGQLEHINTLPPHEQNWGHAFSSFERATDLYVSFIANYRAREDTALREVNKIKAVDGPPEVLTHVRDTVVIQTIFMRPLSRLAKYPLLLRVGAFHDLG
jgi:hypothetical protein